MTSFPSGDVAPGSRGRNLTNKTKPWVLAGKRERGGGGGEKKRNAARHRLPFSDVSPEGKFCSLRGTFAKRSRDLFAQIYMSRSSIGKFVENFKELSLFIETCNLRRKKES